jgi:hypothetical protein
LADSVENLIGQAARLSETRDFFGFSLEVWQASWISRSSDKTIPTEMSRALFEKWDGRLFEYAIREGRHKGLLRYASVQDAVVSFLSEVVDETAESTRFQ